MSGIVASTPVHFLTAAQQNACPAFSDMVIDIGATSQKEVEEYFHIHIGAPVVPDVSFEYDENTDIMLGKAFDNRLGCAAVLESMKELKDHELNVNISGVLSSQEEIGERGAFVTRDVVKPDIAICFEGCPADDTFSPDYFIQTAIKKGPMLRHFDRSMITNPRFQRFALELARELCIPVQESVRSGGGTNGCVSEYIGCHIFESIGIPVQETLLGIYTKKGIEKIVVACKDFTSPGIVLQDFASLKNTIIDSEHNGYGTELTDILDAIEGQRAFNPHILKEWFWDIFIVDALIGNWDRHNGNWGFLYEAETDKISLAPVYDYGSCLYPQADDIIMERTLSEQSERDLRVFQIPLSGIKLNNKKINTLIDETPYTSELQRDFYKTMLQERKEKILDFSLAKLKRQFP